MNQHVASTILVGVQWRTQTLQFSMSNEQFLNTCLSWTLSRRMLDNPLRPWLEPPADILGIFPNYSPLLEFLVRSWYIFLQVVMSSSSHNKLGVMNCLRLPSATVLFLGPALKHRCEARFFHPHHKVSKLVLALLLIAIVQMILPGLDQTQILFHLSTSRIAVLL